MDYALPRADDLPSYALGFNGTRCTTNPLGVINLAGPATAERIWRAMKRSAAETIGTQSR